MTYKIRTMNEDEVFLAIELAANEGWNPGLEDASCFYQTDRHGFWTGELNGRKIAVISAIKYGHNFGFIGFYIVKKEYRGLGYGLKIWQRALKHLQGRNIGLDGVINQQKNYRLSGFKLAHRNSRYQGMTKKYHNADFPVYEINNCDFKIVEEYDQHFFPESRIKFLKAWLNQKNAVKLAIKTNNRIEAYGVIRRCRIGYKIGPLFAQTPEHANTLFMHLCSRVSACEPVFLDIPEPNMEALKLVNSHHMNKVFETARMYTDSFPYLPFDKIYGITSFELG